MSEKEPLKLVLSGEMREHLIAINEAAQASPRHPAYAISVTFVLWAEEFESPQAAKDYLYEQAEWLHEATGIASIYWGDEVKSCEIDDERDIYTDSFEGFPKV
jgi:hypothetical protein